MVLARDGPLAVGALPEASIHPLVEPAVRAGLGRTVAVPDHPGAFVLTDDFNPIDVRDLWLKEKVRRTILETTDPDILLLGALDTAGPAGGGKELRHPIGRTV